MSGTEEPPVSIHWWRWLRRGGLLLVTVVVVEYVVLPQLVTAGDDMSLLASATPWLLVAALGLELSSLLCFSALTRATLPAAGRPSYWTLLRIDLSGLGLGHVLPGGGATAAALRYRLLTRTELAPRDVVTGTTVQTAAAMVVLVMVFLAGLLVSFPQVLHQPSLLASGALAVGLLLVVAAAGVLLTRSRPTTLALVRGVGHYLPWMHAESLVVVLNSLGARLEDLVTDRRLLARTLLWALGNWLLDATCLWVCLVAYGFTEPLGPLLALYGAVNLLCMIPTTPGGLGLVEGVLVPALVSVGAPAPVALLGVITWRLMEFWLPIALALASYASLRVGVLRSQPVLTSHRGAG